jgi:plasmid stability protein
MPTRIEIDDELSGRLEPIAKARGISVRDLVREILRQAVQTGEKSDRPTRYTLPAFDFGTDIDNPWAMFAELESEEYLTLLTRK